MRTIKIARMLMRPKAETATDKKRGQEILNRLRVIRMLWPATAQDRMQGIAQLAFQVVAPQ